MKNKEGDICITCGVKSVRKNYVKNGVQYWRNMCCRCSRNKYEYKYRAHKKAACESCGFVPIDSCQLDVDHIDGDRTNGESANLQTLCANCHRLKTQMDRDNGLYY